MLKPLLKDSGTMAMRILWALIGVIIFLFVVSFVLLNHQLVMLNYYLGAISLPLSVAVLIAFVVGGLFGLFIGALRRRA